MTTHAERIHDGLWGQLSLIEAFKTSKDDIAGNSIVKTKKQKPSTTHKD